MCTRKTCRLTFLHTRTHAHEMATRFRLGLGGAARWLAARPRLLAAGAGVTTFGLGAARTAAVCEPAPPPPQQRTKVLCLHGINLNMFGKRDAGTYGTATLHDIDASLRALAAELDVEVECFQTNHEGEAHVQSIRPAASANAPSSAPRQRQSKLWVASSLGQPRPMGRSVRGRTSKTSWLRPRPAGSPEASLSARSRLRLLQAPASLGQPAG